MKPWTYDSGVFGVRDAAGVCMFQVRHNYGTGESAEHHEIGRLAAAAPRMLELLREYANNGYAEGGCIDCTMWVGTPGIVHADGCRIGALLAEIDGAENPTKSVD